MASHRGDGGARRTIQAYRPQQVVLRDRHEREVQKPQFGVSGRVHLCRNDGEIVVRPFPIIIKQFTLNTSRSCGLGCLGFPNAFER